MYMNINLEDVHIFGMRVNQLKYHRKSLKFEKSGYYYQDMFMGQKMNIAINELMCYTLFPEGKWDSLKKELSKALENIHKTSKK